MISSVRLLTACTEGSLKSIQSLYPNSSNSNWPNEYDDQGNLALIRIVDVDNFSENHKTTLKALIEKFGADVNLKQLSTNKTALHYAAMRGHRKAVKILIQNHANIDPLDNLKQTPLTLAAAYPNNAKVIEILLKNHANIEHDTSESDRITALQIAASHIHIENTRILLSYSANRLALGKLNLSDNILSLLKKTDEELRADLTSSHIQIEKISEPAQNPFNGGPSKTMQAVFYTRTLKANEIGDCYSQNLLTFLPEAQTHHQKFDTMSHGMFSRNILLRTLYFTQLIKAKSSQFPQFINLCSGLDLRSFYIPELEKIKIAHIDHPLSLSFVKPLLDKTNLSRSSLAFVAHDLINNEFSSLFAKLTDQGFDPSLPTMILWEGATYYLDPVVVHNTLEQFSKFFTKLNFMVDFININGYFSNSVVLDQNVAGVLRYLEKLGEPWIGFFDPSKLQQELTNFNFSDVKLIDRSKIEKDLLGSVRMGEGKMFFIDATNFN